MLFRGRHVHAEFGDLRGPNAMGASGYRRQKLCEKIISAPGLLLHGNTEFAESQPQHGQPALR